MRIKSRFEKMAINLATRWKGSDRASKLEGSNDA
jgi:hypothetical protein